MTITYSSTTTAKKFNVLTRQISCTASWKAPEDCVQYFTGASGSVQSYNFQGGQLLTQQQYTNCVRTERGYCGQSRTYHILPLTSHISPLTYHLSPLTSHLSPLTILLLSGILWKESSSTSPDPFQMTANPSTVAGAGAPSKPLIIISNILPPV